MRAAEGLGNVWNGAVLCSWISVQIPGEDIAPCLLVLMAKNKQWRSNSSGATAPRLMTNQCSTTSGARIAVGTETERGALCLN